MVQDKQDPLSAIRPVIEEFLPIVKPFAAGQYAVTIGGSYGKGRHDTHSDLDFRLYAERFSVSFPEMMAAIEQPMANWAQKGVRVDGIWPRTIADIEQKLSRWLEGEVQADHRVWTIWGYHLLPDLLYQRAIEDPFGIVAGWKRRLDPYPLVLKKAILSKHLGSLRYWRDDYHYESKVHRRDQVFLAGLSSRLVHDVIQVLFALNDTYFVGDGQNLEFVTSFEHKPRDAEKRIADILYPPPSERVFVAQREALLSLIGEVVELADALVGSGH